MTVYVFDGTMDGLLTAVFDAFALKESPETVLTERDALPLFCERTYTVHTDEEKARRVWAGLEKQLSREALKLISVSWLSELPELNGHLFRYICKVFTPPLTPPLKGAGNTCGDPPLKGAGNTCGFPPPTGGVGGGHNSLPPTGGVGGGHNSLPPTGGVGGGHNFADPDVLAVTNIARRVLHEQLRMKQFIRFQKAKDGTYLAVVSPDHNVLPLVIDHFQDRFNDQQWLIYDARRHYGYHYDGDKTIRITFEDETALPFNLSNGKLDESVLSSDDQLLQDLWRTYFKAICIRERLNPRKQLNDMPRRYWKYMTEKNSCGSVNF